MPSVDRKHSQYFYICEVAAGRHLLMSKGKISSRFYGKKGIMLVALGLALLTVIAAYGGALKRPVYFDWAFKSFGPQAVSLPVLPEKAAFDLPLRSEVSPLDVSVSLPNVSSTPGLILVKRNIL